MRFVLGYLLYARGEKLAALEQFSHLHQHFPHTVYGDRARRYLEQSGLTPENGAT
jgi:hypothetical protein